MTLNDSVDMLFRISHWSCVSEDDSLLDKSDKLCDIVKLSLLQDTLLGEVLVYDEFAVSQVVGDRTEVRGVSVNKVCSSFILQRVEKKIEQRL